MSKSVRPRRRVGTAHRPRKMVGGAHPTVSTTARAHHPVAQTFLSVSGGGAGDILVPPTPPEPELDLTITARAGKTHVAYLRRQIRAAFPLIKTRITDLSIALVGDKLMSRLHEQFMGIAGPTDVLTFPLETDGRGRPTAGEIVVCVPEAIRQVRTRKVHIKHELLLYAIHGLLHLSGFDDRTAKGYRRMHSMEDAILGRLGVGPVFSPAVKPAPRDRAASGRKA